MTEELAKAQNYVRESQIEYVSWGTLDFKTGEKKIYHFKDGEISSFSPLYDLASLTKPLTVGYLKFLKPDWFGESENLLLSHAGGLPSWGMLTHEGWRAKLGAYDVKKSPQLYSDYSVLRLLLEIEKKQKAKLKSTLEKQLAPFFIHWSEISKMQECPPTGERQGRVIQGEVHDDNAFRLKDFCTHAGLFGKLEDLVDFILRWHQDFKLLDYMHENLKQAKESERFVWGWDRVQNSKTTLAGSLASPFTFGHLGFTGTSMWMDTEKYMGSFLLTNAVKQGWFSSDARNRLRKKLGNLSFSQA